MTELKKFTEAYATMVVASYEPLILKWVSGWGLLCAANDLAWRIPKANFVKVERALATAHALGATQPGPRLPRNLEFKLAFDPANPSVLDMAGRPIDPAFVKKVNVAGFPDAVMVGNTFYPKGVTNSSGSVAPKASSPGFFTTLFGASPAAVQPPGDPFANAKTVSSVLSSRMGAISVDFDHRSHRASVYDRLISAAKASVDSGKDLTALLRESMVTRAGVKIFEFWPTNKIEEALSPIGISNYYRQLYFNTTEGYGPVEEAFTIAPLETLEVMYESVRRQIHEEILEEGYELVSERAAEEKNLDEVSDKVSSMVQRDMSASMSANASGSIGVWQAGASASASMSTSSQRGRETTSRRLKEMTKRASERLTKTFSIKTRSVEDITTTNMTRRVIQNDKDHPVSYGLRRVLRRVHVKVQDLGPRLVWQMYLKNPGYGLALSRFVHFREAEPISVPELPPGVPPRPQGGTDTGSTSADLQWADDRGSFVTLVIQTTPDRVIRAVSIDSITDMEGGGKDDPAPAARNDQQWPNGGNWDAATSTFTVDIGVLVGDSLSLTVAYTYTWEPSQSVLDEWDLLRQDAVTKITEELLTEQFEREKQLITERSKIRNRPAGDLRHEERYEVINRMVSQLFGAGDDPSEPTPLEIEYFHRYFEIHGMFVYLHPSWWKPRYTSGSSGLDRPAYEVTSESDPAALGSSLGWKIQLDGDRRRNEFINSPWVRVCLPIQPGREREAIAWLAKHVEGEIGYDVAKDPLKALLAEVEERRSSEDALGINGPDYVTVSSSPGAPDDPASPEGVFPVVDEFDITVPTDGFVYDELTLG